jgi:hypothetical protein
MATKVFDAKDPDEQVNLFFDFTDALAGDTITGSPVVAITVDVGSQVADGTPTNVLNGSATVVSGNKKVVQPVRAGLAGADYRIEVRVDTTGSTPVRKLVLAGVLPVRDA